MAVAVNVFSGVGLLAPGLAVSVRSGVSVAVITLVGLRLGPAVRLGVRVKGEAVGVDVAGVSGVKVAVLVKTFGTYSFCPL